MSSYKCCAPVFIHLPFTWPGDCELGLERVSAQGQPEKLFVYSSFTDTCKNLSLGIPPSTDQQIQVKELALKTPFVTLHGLDVAPWKAGWNQTHSNLVVQAEESILSCWRRLVVLENFQVDV
ncbi:Inositol 1,4,5-Trisphosphate Receptor Type 2 [Manis pentadactyla]|nr:Inositol 1,4,5-Trisphosphate Receptor Type 2 [Manis pentadactyla]